jgi:hypothetical protein
MLPHLELRFADGRPAPLWEYRGRGPLVVYWHGAPACTACAARLADLAERHADYRAMGAQVLAVGRVAVPDAPYPTLVDPDARLAHALVRAGVLPHAQPPALLVVGRTSEIWAAWGTPPSTADLNAHALLPDQDELAGWLEYALSECRECFCCELAWPESWVRGAT